MATLTDTPSGTRRAVTAPSRRELMSAAGFTALAGIAAVAIAAPDTRATEVLPTGAYPDAELIALCDRIIFMRTENDALARAIPSDIPIAEKMRMEDEKILPLDEKRWDLIEEARAMTARTVEGHRARARMLLDAGFISERDDIDVWALVRDLVGGSV